MLQCNKRNDGHSDPLKARLADAMGEGDNKLCQECMCRGPHTWASWNLGVFLCIRCAGIHRKLGVHISKVKSCTLDQWKREQVNSLASKGNKPAWVYYEHGLPAGHVRPNDTYGLEVFIRNKYERKLYLPRDGSVPLPGEQVDHSVPPETDVRPSETKERKDLEKRVSNLGKVSKSTNSLTVPNAISRHRSQPSSPAKSEEMKPEEASLLLDVGTGITASRSESDFINNFDKLFGIEKTPQKSEHPPPVQNIPTQNQNGSGIDFLEPLVQSSSSPQMNTSQIMSLYSARPQAASGRMGAPFAPKFGPPQLHRYPPNPNPSLYREQQQKLKEVADIQETINSIKVPGGPLPSSQAADGTDLNDPWEQPPVNGMPTQSGKTLSKDLWL